MTKIGGILFTSQCILESDDNLISRNDDNGCLHSPEMTLTRTAHKEVGSLRQISITLILVSKLVSNMDSDNVFRCNKPIIRWSHFGRG